MNKKSLLTSHNLFMVLLLLSLLGVAISDISPVKSHAYWLIMMVLFAGTAILANVIEGDDDNDGVELKKEITQQILHWLGGFVAVMIVYGFYHTGRLTPEATGLVVLLILALTTYLDGIRLGWRFSFAGVFLGIMAVFAAYIEEYMWQILIFAIGIITFSYYWEFKRKKLKPL
ncbi:MAG: hypothetical protein HOP02_16680 [Methylococcaceae bacterium]|nr:hypothetical protein [Methylococcaceae bacterium]